VVGNPPWVRLHRIPPAERHSLRERYDVLRHAAWDAGAAAGGAGAGFAGQADLAALFVERSLQLLRPHGVLSLLVPAKLWTALAGGGVRRLLHTRARVLALEDCSGAPDMFDAVTYPSIVVAERLPSPGVRVRDCADFATHRGTSDAGVTHHAASHSTTRRGARGCSSHRRCGARLSTCAGAELRWPTARRGGPCSA